MLQARGDVIEKDCERPDAGIVKALRLGEQDINRFCSGEVETFPRMEPVNKVNPALPGQTNQLE